MDDKEKIGTAGNDDEFVECADTPLEHSEGPKNDETKTSERTSAATEEEQESAETYEDCPTPENTEEQLRKSALDHKEEGNLFFKLGSYREAIASYSRALDLLPETFAKDRAILHSNRATAHNQHLDSLLSKGSKDGDDFDPTSVREVILEDCSAAVELDPTYIKPRWRRVLVLRDLAKEEKMDIAKEDCDELLKLDPTNGGQYLAERDRLVTAIAARNERLKNEMFDKLKTMGNSVLGKFGLSTDNFKMQPNAEGGYSIQFNNNQNNPDDNGPGNGPGPRVS